jgi:hypothetical protein
MADKYVVEVIEEKPARLFKKLWGYWYFQLTYSVTFETWKEEEEGWMIPDVIKAGKNRPRIVGEIANILNCLTIEFPDDKYDYKNETYLSLAIKFHKAYAERIEKYFKKKDHPNYIGTLKNSPAGDAWKELVLRGFLPAELKLQEGHYYYLTSTVGNLVRILPKKMYDETKFEDIVRAQSEFGVIGYTGYNQPKK